ncbi:peptide ABC transporter [Kytococcus sp. CUA-901]|nr:peptide ABC transporter [Kytococcus sp. CUA-901]
MIRFLAHRAGQALITLFLASVVVFVGIRALPGDPALALAGEDRSPEALAAIRADLGLDQPLPVQYFSYMGNVLQGDLGNSSRTGEPVTAQLGTALPVTLQLAALSMLVSVVLGVAAGVIAAVARGTIAEWLANGLALVGLSVPNFWLGIVAIVYLAVGLGWFPASGYVPFTEDPLGALHHLFLPSVILGTGLAAIVMRQTRSSMLESLSADYVRTARAKGAGSGSVIFRHALRNSLVVVLTILGLQLGGLISGAVVTEQIFGLPGFGKAIVDAVFQRDYAVIQAVVLITAAAYVLINFAVDVLYSVLDPRIRTAGGNS